MVLEKLSDSLKNTLGKIAKAIFVDDKLLNELIKDLQRALLQADVNVQLVFSLTNQIKESIKKEDLPKGLTKKEQLINTVYEELVKFLGKEQYALDIKKKPFIIMLVGLYGSGKTTTSGKLARYFTKRGHKAAILGLDVYRPAAMAQVEQVAKQANIHFFIDKKEKSPINIWNAHKDELKKFDIILIDTAGRDALSVDLIQEISSLNQMIQPDEKFLVISADIGQSAQKQAEEFHKSCNITGVIVSKMDGTAKAGGALSACSITKSPIVFIGTGEKLEDLEHFNPQGFVGRLLGMGDIEALLEKAKEAITEEEAEDLSKRLLKGEFTLIDLFEQMEAMSKMGPLNKIMEMIPGFSQIKLPKEILDVQQGKLVKWKHAMQSMTKEELETPDEVVDSGRIDRVAKGSGVSASDVRLLMKQYREGKKMVKMLKGTGGDMGKIMKKFQGKMPKMF